jgi:hypothetical protein
MRTVIKCGGVYYNFNTLRDRLRDYRSGSASSGGRAMDTQFFLENHVPIAVGEAISWYLDTRRLGRFEVIEGVAHKGDIIRGIKDVHNEGLEPLDEDRIVVCHLLDDGQANCMNASECAFYAHLLPEFAYFHAAKECRPDGRLYGRDHAPSESGQKADVAGYYNAIIARMRAFHVGMLFMPYPPVSASTTYLNVALREDIASFVGAYERLREARLSSCYVFSFATRPNPLRYRQARALKTIAADASLSHSVKVGALLYFKDEIESESAFDYGSVLLADINKALGRVLDKKKNKECVVEFLHDRKVAAIAKEHDVVFKDDLWRARVACAFDSL